MRVTATSSPACPTPTDAAGSSANVRRTIGPEDSRFTFHTFDCHKIPFEAESFDLVIANHVLFYCED
ncbi:MAG: methyltransferase domain-containing protein, partial [Ruminococcus sp.]|nr:methyltransferase domain-containing protein [Ruminococcus sp.]